MNHQNVLVHVGNGRRLLEIWYWVFNLRRKTVPGATTGRSTGGERKTAAQLDVLVPTMYNGEPDGGVSEWSMVAVLKTAVPGSRDRGFESHPLRLHSHQGSLRE